MLKHNLLFTPILLIVSMVVNAQQLYIAPGTSFNILAGTDVSVDSLVLTPSATFSLSDNAITKTTLLVNSLGTTHILKGYHFSNTTDPFTGKVVFGYAEGAQLNGLQEDALRLYSHDGAAWAPFLTGFVTDDVNNTVSVTGISAQALNEFTLGSAGVLPLTWLGVQAARKNENTEVKWQTAAESSIAYYTVERSLDAHKWINIATNIAPQQTYGTGHYTITDYNSPSEQLYYRVKETTKSGANSYSVIVSVAPLNTGNSNNAALIYPNPAYDYFKVGKIAADGLKEIQLIDIAGSKLKSWKMLQSTYNVNSLPAGVYQLVFIYRDKIIKTSFTKL